VALTQNDPPAETTHWTAPMMAKEIGISASSGPKPFTWTADPDKIIAAVKRGHQVLDSIH
jgi:hypothetical protein